MKFQIVNREQLAQGRARTVIVTARQKFQSIGLMLVLLTTCATPLHSATYRYNGNAPPAKMMLDMMEVMGFIYRVPDNRSGYNSSLPMTSLWGLSPMAGSGMLGNNMMAGGLPALSGLSAMNQMNQWPGSGMGMMQPSLGSLYGLPNAAMTNPGFRPLTNPYSYPQQSNSAASTQVDSYQPSLWSSQTVEHQLSDRALSHKVDELKSMITDLQSNNGNRPQSTSKVSISAPQLAGVWQTADGEVLNIAGNRFIWTDTQGQSHPGTFSLKGDLMQTLMPEHNKTLLYRLALKQDKLIAVSQAGHRYNFSRVR